MRKYVVILLVLLIGITFVWLFSATLENLRKREKREDNLLTFPSLSLLTLDSADHTIKTNQLTVLIYFNSTCEHCRYEMQDIYKKIKLFERSQVVFMSSEQLAKIGSFANSSGLVGFPNVRFTKIEPEHAAAVFGPLSIPHIFIYGKDGELRKEFKGETKAEAIAKYFN